MDPRPHREVDLPVPAVSSMLRCVRGNEARSRRSALLSEISQIRPGSMVHTVALQGSGQGEWQGGDSNALLLLPPLQVLSVVCAEQQQTFSEDWHIQKISG